MRDYPLVVASRSGHAALELEALVDIGRVPNRDAVAYYFDVRHQPKGRGNRLTVMFSGTTYGLRDEFLGIPTADDRRETFESAAIAVIGDYLDEEGMPPEAGPGEPAPTIECFSPRFTMWRDRKPADDETVEAYLRSHLYWSWKFETTPWVVGSADTVRLRLPLTGIDRLVRLGEGEEWDIQSRDGKEIHLEPLPQLLKKERAARATSESPRPEVMQPPASLPIEQADPEEVPVLQYVDEVRIADLKRCEGVGFDLSKLIAMCEELNQCWRSQCYHAVAALNRAVMDHVPPLLGCTTFSEIANNYAGSRSFKDCMLRLQNVARKIGDSHLHTPIRSKESLPTRTQVNFSNELDMLIAEIVRVGCGEAAL